MERWFFFVILVDELNWSNFKFLIIILDQEKKTEGFYTDFVKIKLKNQTFSCHIVINHSFLTQCDNKFVTNLNWFQIGIFVEIFVCATNRKYWIIKAITNHANGVRAWFECNWCFDLKIDNDQESNGNGYWTMTTHLIYDIYVVFIFHLIEFNIFRIVFIFSITIFSGLFFLLNQNYRNCVH